MNLSQPYGNIVKKNCWFLCASLDMDNNDDIRVHNIMSKEDPGIIQLYNIKEHVLHFFISKNGPRVVKSFLMLDNI